KERLQRHRRAAANIRGCIRVRTVEERQKWMALQPLGHQVDATVLRWIHVFEWSMLRPSPFVDWRKRMRTGATEIQIAANSKHRVTDRFGIQPPAVKTPVPAVAGVFPFIVCVAAAR